jgi:pyridoxal phosphate enzyme (YggS family)
MSIPTSKPETDGVPASQQALANVRDRIAEAIHIAGRDGEAVELVAVSKTFDADAIVPVLEAGQRVFGENRVQEALGKWPDLKQRFSGTKLHLIGPLQSNKTADAVGLFDVIETVDRPKIAKALAGEMKRQGREIELFVQVNTGAEPQKAGVMPEETDQFVELCRDDLGLKIAGLMCIPPFDEEPALHFALLSKIAERNQLENLSMGMSSDFETAIAFGATHVRVGSAIFGQRTQKIA